MVIAWKYTFIIDISRDLEVSILVWVTKLGDQESFLVQYILRSLQNSDK